MAPTAVNDPDSSTSESDSEMILDMRNVPLKNSKSNTESTFGPLVVAFVGLPARGKTVLAHKLSRYLKWSGVETKVFSVCDYCRKHIELYNHNMFRADNREALEMRQRSTIEAMEDATKWLKGYGQVAILDGTNTNKKYRQLLHEYFVKQLNYKILFVECICDEDNMLERNIKEILKFNVDYKRMKKEVAMNDLRCKIEHFKEQYETINRRTENYSFVKIINGGEDISVHKINSPLESKILCYISNAKLSFKTLYFTRHGESEFNLLGRIGGDASLSPRGFQYAQCLGHYFNQANLPGLRIWTSQKRRTKETALNIQAHSESVEALNELDAGVCEGLTYEEIQEQYPREFAWRDQDKLRYRYPWGESYIDIMKRLEPVLLQLESEDDNVLVISHQAVLRCVLGYFVNKDLETLPYFDVPLHTIIKLTSEGYNYNMEYIKLNVDCVNTHRKQPKNCSSSRSPQEALLTVPSHFNKLNFWNKNVVGPS